MSPFDAAVLAERAATIERHLARVAQRLPHTPDGFEPATDASDAVILHLWQATQIVIDLAVSLCVARGLGTPQRMARVHRAAREGPDDLRGFVRVLARLTPSE